MKIISYLIFIFYFNIIQAATPAFDPSTARSYKNGCLEEVQRSSNSFDVRHHLLLSAGMSPTSCVDRVARTSSYADLPREANLCMSAVMCQGELCSCTAFAIIAALESFIPGTYFSEAELYMRVKTKGRSDRMKEGVALSDYIPLLSEGPVLSDNFLKYQDYLDYIEIRKRMADSKKMLPTDPPIFQSDILSSSCDYQSSIEEFKDWCLRSSRCVPSHITESYRVRVNDDFVPTPVRIGLCYLNPLYWAVRTLSDDPTLRFERIVTRTRTVVSYYSIFRFIMYPIPTYEAYHPKDPFYRIKFALLSRKPVVISVKIFKMPWEKRDLWDRLWGRSDYNTIIDLPPKEAETDTNHAICLYGYDDSRQAFRFKNSWGEHWAHYGYAWITYKYVKEHTNSAFVIEIME